MKPPLFIHVKEFSERVPNKNFRILPNGLPLWEHTIRKFAPFFNIWLDTDSQDIIDQLNRKSDYPTVCAYMRDEKLRGPVISAVPLVAHAIEKWNLKGIITQVNVTTPFLEPETVLRAIDLKGVECDSVVSCDILHSRLWKGEDLVGYLPVNHVPQILRRSQDLAPIYLENSGFYVFDCDQFMKFRSRVGFKPKFVQSKFPENIDIDTEEDWKLMEACFKLPKSNIQSKSQFHRGAADLILSDVTDNDW